jgi:NAD(P)-dependent dehydrogenase (short-subunit alcohol dehydrogenase family)
MNDQTNVMNLFRIDGKRALVTGGGRGLGRVISQALAEAGADVAVASRQIADCQTAAKEITQATGRKTLGVSVDVTDASSVDKMAATVEKELGPVDILVNNAGINIRAPISDINEEDWDAVMATNLKGPFLCSRKFGPSMASRGWGRVINLGSIMSVVGFPARASYATSKAGVMNLTRVLALEWASTGVTVNSICPGPFATEMNLPLMNDPAKYKAFMERVPMGRWGELHEIAGVAVFLASDAASFVTGSALFVDGGWTAQ